MRPTVASNIYDSLAFIYNYSSCTWVVVNANDLSRSIAMQQQYTVCRWSQRVMPQPVCICEQTIVYSYTCRSIVTLTFSHREGGVRGEALDDGAYFNSLVIVCVLLSAHLRAVNVHPCSLLVRTGYVSIPLITAQFKSQTCCRRAVHIELPTLID